MELTTVCLRMTDEVIVPLRLCVLKPSAAMDRRDDYILVPSFDKTEYSSTQYVTAEIGTAVLPWTNAFRNSRTTLYKCKIYVCID